MFTSLSGLIISILVVIFAGRGLGFSLSVIVAKTSRDSNRREIREILLSFLLLFLGLFIAFSSLLALTQKAQQTLGLTVQSFDGLITLYALVIPGMFAHGMLYFYMAFIAMSDPSTDPL